MDKLIEQLPLFTPEQLNLASSVASLVEREIEPWAMEERGIADDTRNYVKGLANAGVLRYAVASSGASLDVRAFSEIIRRSRR